MLAFSSSRDILITNLIWDISVYRMLWPGKHEFKAHIALKNWFWTAVTDIFVSFSCDLLHIPFLASAILRWLQDFWKISAPLVVTNFFHFHNISIVILIWCLEILTCHNYLTFNFSVLLQSRDCQICPIISMRTCCYKRYTQFEGCFTVHLPHEIKWNANLM